MIVNFDKDKINESSMVERSNELWRDHSKRNEQVEINFMKFIEYKSNNENVTKIWVKFYEFVISAYNVNREERPSVCEVCDRLELWKIDNNANLSVLYAHCLLVLAQKDKEKFGNDEFII